MLEIDISRRWGWARHLPGGWSNGGPWSTGGKWTQRCTASTHAPRPDHDSKKDVGISFFLYLQAVAVGVHHFLGDAPVLLMTVTVTMPPVTSMLVLILPTLEG